MKRISIILVAVIASLAIVSCNNNESAKVELNNFDDSLSYAIGMRLYDMYVATTLTPKPTRQSYSRLSQIK